MKAAICYITWNRFEYTKKSLISILENTKREDYELIIWDNGSDDGSIDWIRNICNKNKFLYLFFKRNEGLTRAMNNQMRIMDRIEKFDVFCHIANDIIVPKFWLDGVFEAIQSKKVGAVGLNLENKIADISLVDDLELEKITTDGCIGGMHYCIPKWIYDLLGGFKHVTLGYGQQDANYSLQIKLLPFDVWDYYLSLKKYKGENLGDTGKIYNDYQRKIRQRLRKSGSDSNAGREYRSKLRHYRTEYDTDKITAEQLIKKLRDNDIFLLVDKSQLKETNMETKCL